MYKKQTNTDKYIHWNSFATIKWKRNTLSTIIQCAHTIYSNQRSLDEELNHIRQNWGRKDLPLKTFSNLEEDSLKTSK